MPSGFPVLAKPPSFAVTDDMVNDASNGLSAPESAETQLERDELGNDELNYLNPDPNQGIEKVYMLDEALAIWTEGLPPFIEDSIPEGVHPGDRMQVWRLQRGWPKKDPDDFVTVCQWKDTDSKYFTWKDLERRSCIVKATGYVKDRRKSERVFLPIWHGLNDGWAPKAQIWTRKETKRNHRNLATFNPETILEGAKGAILEREDRSLEDAEKPSSAGSQPQQSTNTTKTRNNRLPAKRQRETSPSSQLQNTPSSNHNDTLQSEPGGGKRHRANPDGRHERHSASGTIVKLQTGRKSSTKTASLPRAISINSDSEKEAPKPNDALCVGSDVGNNITTTRPRPAMQPSATFNSSSGEDENIRRELKDAEDQVLNIKLEQAQRRVADAKSRLKAKRRNNVTT